MYQYKVSDDISSTADNVLKSRNKSAEDFVEDLKNINSKYVIISYNYQTNSYSLAIIPSIISSSIYYSDMKYPLDELKYTIKNNKTFLGSEVSYVKIPTLPFKNGNVDAVDAVRLPL